MYLKFESRDEFVRWAQDNIMTPQEVADFLGTTLQAVGQSVRNGKLHALKKQDRTTLFLREDVIARRDELKVLREKYRPYDES